MELNERKKKILKAIIQDYLETAEPVGSRTISKNYDLGISPATIRNEMSDLEELGFIMQPHTSAGRIPSDKGYRFYVDTLLNGQNVDYEHVSLLEQLIERAGKIEGILQNIAKMLAQETSYATIVSTPAYKRTHIKSIQLVKIEENKLLAIVVNNGNIINNFMIDIHEPMSAESLNDLASVLNHHLNGLTLEEINLPIIQSLKKQAGPHREVVSALMDMISHSVQSIDDTQIYTSGTTNILKLPEFADVSKAMELIDTLEQKDNLKNMISSAITNQEDGIEIKIGEEIELETMKNCSLITTSYHIGGERVGVIGIIGPKRMDYSRTISCLKHIIQGMEKLIEDTGGS